MIKSLPIENILPKASLSSKKSAQSGDSAFRGVLDKVCKTGNKADDEKGKNITEAASIPNKDMAKVKTDKKDKKEEKKEKTEVCVCVVENKTGNIDKNGDKKANIKKDMKKGLEADIKVENINKGEVKDKKVIKNADIDKDEIPFVKTTKDEKVKNTDVKKDKDIAQNKDTDKKQILVFGKEKMKTEAEKSGFVEKSDDKKIKVKAEYKDASLKLNAKPDDIKDEEKKITKIAHNNTVSLADPNNDIQKTKKAADMPDSKNAKRPDAKDNIAYVFKNPELSIETKNKTKDTTDNKGKDNVKQRFEKGSVRVAVAGNDLGKIKDKYAKKLDIQKISVSKTDFVTDKTGGKDVKNGKAFNKVSLNGHKTNRTNYANNLSEQNKKVSVQVPLKSVETVDSIKKQDKTIKIKVIKEIKSGKTVKFKVLETVKNDKVKVKKNGKVDDSLKMRSLLQNEGIRETQTSGKHIKFVAKKVPFEAEIEETGNRKDKKIDKIETAVLGATTIKEHSVANASDMAKAAYPMDKVIENIDKMLNMKPPFNNTVTIKLNPPHIGVMELRVKMDRDKNISAVITAEDKNVLKIINLHMDGLKTYLNSHGVRVSHIDVHNGFHEQAGFGNSQNQGMFNNNQQNGSGNSRFGGFQEALGSDGTFNSSEGVLKNSGVKINGVDITV